jgi:glucosamine 6-phosphate synthetase-like amidotransferase/phosphosugar isomerase protein
MCGIVGYIGKQNAAPILLEGLRRLEYRGYDSAGIAVLAGHELSVRKKKGEIDEGLAHLLAAQSASGHLGIGHIALAICNVVGSTIAREADGGIYLHAGPEIGVASTKAFVSQVTVLTLLALYMGRMRMLAAGRAMELIRALEAVPRQIETLLAQTDLVHQIVDRFSQARDFFFLGRQYHFPVALEGALKLKELSYIHAEGYPAAEMKHGPIALIDEHTPTVILILNGTLSRSLNWRKAFSLPAQSFIVMGMFRSA